MNDITEKALLEKLERLRLGYLGRLPDELTALRALAEDLDGGDQDRAHLEALHERLHKLAGSGGSFGCMALSAAARVLEQRTNAWLAGDPAALDTTARNTLFEDLCALGDTLADVCETPELTAGTGAGPAAGKSLLVWLVEDDNDLGRQLMHQLGSFNYTVRLFAHLEDAERAAQLEQPDLLILDVMDNQTGENSTESIQRFPYLRGLVCPLLFITAHDDFASRVRAARLGAMGYFLKPIDIPNLVSRIAQIFDQRLASPQRVLIVDDDTDLAEHMRLVLLASGMKAEVLEVPEDIMKTVSGFRPELVLMDLHMPSYSGSDLAGVIRQHAQYINLPIVYLSAETDIEQQIEAMKLGADDFLTKPIPDLQLIAAARARIARARQLEEQISKDSLTGLLKHAAIKDAVHREVPRAKRIGKPVTLAMLDIDHFKAVNDTYGHAIGDVVIASLATLLRQRLRQSDIIGRYGGEEFVAVLPECDGEHATRLMDSIRQHFSSLRFGHDDKHFLCTISIGLACSAENPDSDSERLLASADEALYKAKRGGRNRIACYGD
jgi:diguanylate cyclase (GGDEF)-like protein